MERHDAIQPLLTDFVLGDLDPAERRRVESHVRTCEACATEVRELGLAFHGIGLAEEPVAPPPQLRARVLESMQQSRPAYLPPERRGVHPGWLAAAATALLVLGGVLFVTTQRNRSLETDLRIAEETGHFMQQQLAANETQADLAVAILTAPDMRRVDLEGAAASRNAVARAYWSASTGLLIVADRLPEPPPGRVYQVWLIGSRSAGPVSAGLIDDPRSGRGMLIVPAPAGVAGETVTIAVTDEPTGGLPSPTGQRHLIGS